MPKRQLNAEEKSLTEKSIKRFEERKAEIEPTIDYYNYMISKGLMINYNKQYKEHLDKKRQIEDEVRILNLNTIELQRQLKEGVEIKNIKEIKDKKDKEELCPQCGQGIKNG